MKSALIKKVARGCTTANLPVGLFDDIKKGSTDISLTQTLSFKSAIHKTTFRPHRLHRSRCRFEADSSGPTSPIGRGHFWGLSDPLKSIGNSCCGVRRKMDHSILNNGTTCDAAFCHNSLTTFNNGGYRTVRPGCCAVY